MTSSSGVFISGPSRPGTNNRRVRIDDEAIMREDAEASTLIVNPHSHMVTTL